jgi:hypothetical protein
MTSGEEKRRERDAKGWESSSSRLCGNKKVDETK